jgi:hypothetical protein
MKYKHARNIIFVIYRYLSDYGLEGWAKAKSNRVQIKVGSQGADIEVVRVSDDLWENSL